MILKNPVYFALFFATLWIAIFYLSSLLTGWHELARAYRFSGEFDGERWRWQSAQMRWCTHYNNCLTVGANRQGLYLAMPWIFRAGHPSLFIPWTDVSTKTKRFLRWEFKELQFREVPSVPLRITERLSQRIATAAGDAWPKPEEPAGRLAV